MTLNIELREEQRIALTAKARALGISAEDYARQVLEHDLAPEWLQKSWKSSTASGASGISMEEIDAEITAARQRRYQSPA